MGSDVVVPAAVLGSMCAGMFIFIWWWYPRTWKKGNKAENEIMGLEVDAGGDNIHLTQQDRMRIAGQRAREYVAAVDARNKAKAAGLDIDEPLPVYQGHRGRMQPPQYTPAPPAEGNTPAAGR